jgi:mRNA interferase MazF
VLVRFPFTDLSSAKKRPAVVVSPKGFASRYGDVVVIAVTSRAQTETSLALRDWRAAGLVKPTWFKPLIGTLSASIVVRRLGTLGETDRQQLVGVLDLLLDRSVRKR